MYQGTRIFGNVTVLEGLHVTGKYKTRSMQHTAPGMRPGILTGLAIPLFLFRGKYFGTPHSPRFSQPAHTSELALSRRRARVSPFYGHHLTKYRNFPLHRSSAPSYLPIARAPV